MQSSVIMALKNKIDIERAQPIKFNIMVIGEANSGKTSYIETFLEYKINKKQASAVSNSTTSDPKIHEYR